MRLQHLFTAVLLAVTAAAPPRRQSRRPRSRIRWRCICKAVERWQGEGDLPRLRLGTHFFLEEPSGVTVYVYDESVGYRKEAFLKGATLAKAMKKYK